MTWPSMSTTLVVTYATSSVDGGSEKASGITVDGTAFASLTAAQVNLAVRALEGSLARLKSDKIGELDANDRPDYYVGATFYSRPYSLNEQGTHPVTTGTTATFVVVYTSGTSLSYTRQYATMLVQHPDDNDATKTKQRIPTAYLDTSAGDIAEKVNGLSVDGTDYTSLSVAQANKAIRCAESALNLLKATKGGLLAGVVFIRR